MKNRATLILTTVKRTLLVISKWYSKAGYSHTYYMVISADSWLPRPTSYKLINKQAPHQP